jgi:hypothetical protein
MTRIDAHPPERGTGDDGSTIAPLLEEVHATETAWREGALPR